MAQCLNKIFWVSYRYVYNSVSNVAYRLDIFLSSVAVWTNKIHFSEHLKITVYQICFFLRKVSHFGVGLVLRHHWHIFGGNCNQCCTSIAAFHYNLWLEFQNIKSRTFFQFEGAHLIGRHGNGSWNCVYTEVWYLITSTYGKERMHRKFFQL